MLSPEYLKDMPNELVSIFAKLEEDIIADISRRISKGMELTDTADYQINILQKMGYNLDDIEKEIAKATKLGKEEVKRTLEESSYIAHNNDIDLYKIGGKVLSELQPAMVDYINATIKHTQGELDNITKSLGIVTNAGPKDLTTFYRETLNNATIQLGSGAFDYNTILKKAVKTLCDSGIRSIDYKSGYSSNVDVAVRRSVMTANAQITGKISEMNADMMEQDLMEITSHGDSRPDHAEWQGQIVSREGNRKYLSLDDIGYGEGGGFKGWNCRHDWFAYFEGISVRSPMAEETEPIKYNDREYTAYEASQKQRAIERAIRKTKRELIAYDNAGLKEDFTSSSIKLSRQRKEYNKFSKAAGIRPKHERHQTYKYGRSVSMKSVHARK